MLLYPLTLPYNLCFEFNFSNTVWPDGKRQRKTVPREDNTKLRTRMAAKIALLYLLSGKRFVESYFQRVIVVWFECT